MTRPGRLREYEVLRTISEALNRSTDTSAALERTLALAARLLGFETGWVWLRDAENGRFYLAASYNLPPYLRKPVRMTGSHCWCIQSFLAGDFATRNVDAVACSRLAPAFRSGEAELARGIAYHASVILRFGARDLGIMNLTAPSFRRVAKGDLTLLQTIADQTGIAIERARLAESATLLARTRERAELARDLHDTFTQDLTGIALQLETALQYLAAGDVRAREGVATALAVARSGVDRARRSVEALRETSGGGVPLDSSLARLARTFTSQSGIPVHARVEAAGAPAAVEQTAYRIVNEALINVRRHAAANAVWLDVARSHGRLVVRVRDDGRGIPKRLPPGHFGIVGMRERALALGGSLVLRRPRGGGTEVRASIPLVAR